MSNSALDGADRMRRVDQMIEAVDAKLESHRSELGKSHIVQITCRYDTNSRKWTIKVQPTY